MRPDKSTHWRELGDRVARLAQDLAGCAARAHELGCIPPAAVVIGERDLWRWAETLRQTNQPPAADPGRLVAIALLVAVDDRRELTAVADTIVRAAGRQGGWWHIRHVTAYPDPAAIFDLDDGGQVAAVTPASLPIPAGTSSAPSAGGQERDGGGELG